jgi:hypothetical protein
LVSSRQLYSDNLEHIFLFALQSLSYFSPWTILRAASSVLDKSRPYPDRSLYPLNMILLSMRSSTFSKVVLFASAYLSIRCCLVAEEWNHQMVYINGR